MRNLLNPFLFCLLGLPLFAQTGLPSFRIPRIDTPPQLSDFKGMVPSESIAKKMVKVSGFIQREPYDGKAATYDTHVYLAYDSKELYAIFLAFDDEPELIRARMSPRENVRQDDMVNIMVDTFNDRRRAYTFLTTARGIQWDGLWTEGKDFDQSYDALWSSEGELTDKGYMVRIAVPFSTLRFDPETNSEWHVIFNRTIPRLNEESFWPRYTIDIQGRLNQAATMTGIEGVEPGRNFRLNPYVFARNYKILDREQADFLKEDFDPEVGLDAKLVVADAFVLDVTANPDFSQVESDSPQVTVNERFEVNFPEKRPFFLENADFFRTFTNLVFTRRIVEPSGGIRFTGKKNGWSIGTMLIDDKAPGRVGEEGDPGFGDSAEIGVVRINRDVLDQSTVGVLYTHRRFAGNENRVMAVDGRIKFNDNWLTEFQAAHSETDHGDHSEEGNSFNVMVNRSGRHLSMHNHFLRTDPHFATQLGFLNGEQRPDSKNIHHQSSYTFRPKDRSLVAWGPSVRLGRAMDTDNDALDDFLTASLDMEWSNNTEFEFSYAYNEQRLTPNDFSQLNEDITLTDSRFSLELEGEVSSVLQYDLEYRWGTNINFVPRADQAPSEADLQVIEGSLTWRPIAPLQVDGTYLLLSLDDKESGDDVFENTIARLRANYQFTRSWSLRFITQLEETDVNSQLTRLNQDRNWNTDLLVRYVVNPWTALYLGYNSNDSNYQLVDGEYGREVVRTDHELRNDGRQFFLKFSYLFQY